MDKDIIFNFKSDISKIQVSDKLNNPFTLDIPEIASIAAKEFQQFITIESENWKHDFNVQKGKMFGILVVQLADGTTGFLGTISGKIPGNEICEKFVPSVFDDSIDDFFINRGMTELTQLGNTIKKTNNQGEAQTLREIRKKKSFALQNRLFENYYFLSCTGEEQNALQIFERSTNGKPPSAAGECAAPKLLQYAFKHQLRPLALAEFWWGKQAEKKEKEHKAFYPACKNKCRPILEFMLNDRELYRDANYALLQELANDR